MKRKTADLSGAALDWAVAKCEGDILWLGEQPFCADEYGNNGRSLFTPSIDWSQGGPIIEREHIHLRSCYNGGIPNQGQDACCADLHFVNGVMVLGKFAEYGPTPLIAAMRCYVASKLGDEVGVPEEIA